MASDEGGAVNELQSTGLDLSHARFDNVLRSITRLQGLWVEGGVIVSPVVDIHALPGIRVACRECIDNMQRRFCW